MIILLWENHIILLDRWAEAISYEQEKDCGYSAEEMGRAVELCGLG